MVSFRPLLLVVALGLLPLVHAAPPFPLPSASLEAYAANNLEHLLGPLNGGNLPRTELMKLETDLKARLGQGIPEEKAMLQAAVAVCAGFDKIIDAREKAVLNMQQAAHPATSGRQESKARQQLAQASDAFIVSSAENSANVAWRAHVQPWRVEMQQLLVAEKQAEAAFTATALAASAPKPEVKETDPVVGSWLLEGRSPLELNPDHTISGDRHGHWSVAKSDDGKHHYELHWNPPKNWTDYLVLSEDGKTLQGKTRGNKPIAANRP
jgi:hypothetical protein